MRLPRLRPSWLASLWACDCLPPPGAGQQLGGCCLRCWPRALRSWWLGAWPFWLASSMCTLRPSTTPDEVVHPSLLTVPWPLFGCYISAEQDNLADVTAAM